VCCGTLDFKGWLEGLAVRPMGLVPNPWTQDLHTNHCWRVVRRGDLPSYHCKGNGDWQVVDLLQVSDVEASDKDAILLLKEWEASERLSQKPVLLLPHECLAKLKTSELKIKARLGTPKSGGKQRGVQIDMFWYVCLQPRCQTVKQMIWLWVRQ